MAWEILSDLSLRRLKVPGGWLVQQATSTSTTGDITFLPDSTYSWTVAGPVPTPVPEPIPVPTPTPTPVPAPTKWIGTNLGGLVDWSTDIPFRNFMLNSRTPFSASTTTGAWNDTRTLNLDARGNILSLAPDQIARRVIFTAQRPQVDMLLTWEGEGTVGFGGFQVISSPSSTSRIIRPSTANGNAWLNILTVNPANPLRNIQLVRVDQKDMTGLFNPDFLNEMKKYACIRFMDWQSTNALRPLASLQADFAPLTALPVTLNANAPVEVMVQLCNEANVDGWFCIPITADAAYIDRFLNVIKNKLNTNLKARIELSNEVWNSMFPQHTFVGGANLEERLANYGIKSSDLHLKVKSILGSRGISVLASQASAPFWQNVLIEKIKSAGKPLPEVFSTAPYFGDNLNDVNAFADGRVDAIITKMVNYAKETVALAEKNGMKVELYEAGQHFMPGIEMNRDLRIGTAYKRYLSEMKTAIKGGLLCHYFFIGAWGTSGSWGEKEYLYAPDTAKTLAIKESM